MYMEDADKKTIRQLLNSNYYFFEKKVLAKRPAFNEKI